MGSVITLPNGISIESDGGYDDDLYISEEAYELLDTYSAEAIIDAALTLESAFEDEDAYGEEMFGRKKSAFKNLSKSFMKKTGKLAKKIKKNPRKYAAGALGLGLAGGAAAGAGGMYAASRGKESFVLPSGQTVHVV